MISKQVIFLFAVKGQTVTPQLRPPHGSLPITDVKKDDSEYKGNTITENELHVHVGGLN